VLGNSGSSFGLGRGMAIEFDHSVIVLLDHRS